MKKKVHLQTEVQGKPGSRSVCRYSSRVGRRVILMPLDDFIKLPTETQCSECRESAAETVAVRAASQSKDNA